MVKAGTWAACKFEFFGVKNKDLDSITLEGIRNGLDKKPPHL